MRNGVDTGNHSNLPLYLAIVLAALILLWWVRRRTRKAFISKEGMIDAIEENQQLVSLRDFLLPMLMNGRVKVNG